MKLAGEWRRGVGAGMWRAERVMPEGGQLDVDVRADGDACVEIRRVSASTWHDGDQAVAVVFFVRELLSCFWHGRAWPCFCSVHLVFWGENGR